MEHLPVVITSFAIGATAAFLLRGRLPWLVSVAPMVLGGGGGMRDMKMLMVVRSDLEIGKNEAASQCSHVAISCYKRALADAPDILRKWERQGQTKVVVKAPSEEELLKVAQDAQMAGLVTVVIHDSMLGRQNTPIVLGIGPGPASLVAKVAGHLKLF